MSMQYQSAPGRDERIVKIGQHSYSTMQTAFGGLQGFHMRLIRITGARIAVADHVRPFPLRLSGQNGEHFVVHEHTHPDDMSSEAMSALTNWLFDANEELLDNKASVWQDCCVCKSSVNMQVDSTFAYGGEGVKNTQRLKELQNVVAQFYYHCDNAACHIAVRKMCKESCAAPDDVVPFTWGCCNPGCKSVAKLARPLKACSGCRVNRYCSSQCQAEHWKDHSPMCKALKDARTVAKTEERRQKEQGSAKASGEL